MTLSDTGLSMLMPWLAFDGDQQLIETVVVSIGVCVVILVVSEFAMMFAESHITGSPEMRKRRERLHDRVNLWNGLVARQARLEADLTRVAGQLDIMESRRAELARRIAERDRMDTMVVRRIGEPRAGLTCFHALMTNSRVMTYVARGISHPSIDDSWARAQLVEVWAESVLLAQLMLREKYPKAQGYVLDSVRIEGS